MSCELMSFSGFDDALEIGFVERGNRGVVHREIEAFARME
jgi:hypothetical protein